MDKQLTEWTFAVQRLWSATAPDYRAAERLAFEIARSGEEATLRQAAAQALPALRNAALKKADRSTKDLAWRRLSVLRDVLYARSAPRFGKRGNAPVTLTPGERHRQLLGLPLGRRLSGAEIHQGYKRAAKTAHPDTGGNEQKFHALSEARDALMKER
jgi:hypothetical protein